MPQNLTRVPSFHSVSETLDRLTSALQSKHITVFARIDHSGEAKKAGLALRPTEVLIFGNPRSGTPLMQAVQESAIDLPIKALAWQDKDDKVWLGWNSPEYLRARFNLPQDLVQNLAGVIPLLESAAAA